MTRHIDAFVADGPEAGPVLAMARVLGEVFRVGVEAVHVGAADDRLARLARESDVDLRTVEGDPTEEIVAEMASADVLLGVLGARRRPHGPRPAGHVALEVIGRVSRMVAVVPPQAYVPEPGGLQRILVPLDGTEESAAAVRSLCEAFARSAVEIVVVHIFRPGKVPAFWDQPHYAEEAWGEEFRARFLRSTGGRVRLRTGIAQERILAVAEEEDVDAIALGWAQRLDPGRARVVRRILSHGVLPVLLVPVGAEPGGHLAPE